MSIDVQKQVLSKLKGRAKKPAVATKKVSFLVVGAQKSGTTALHAYFRRHPEICMAKKKEIHFFDDDTYFVDGKADYKAYHSFFDPTASQRLLGEVTPAYMYWYEATRRIWEYNPNIKLIAVLRNPITRAYSHWNMLRDWGKETRSFWEAIHSEDEKVRESLPFQSKPYSYISRGFYSEQIRRLKFYFPETQILFLKSENLRGKPNECLYNIWSFLGLDSIDYVEPIIEHSRSYPLSMSDREREYLHNIFEYEIKQLERMLNWDCSAWLKS